jgi:hypothetical protein
MGRMGELVERGTRKISLDKVFALADALGVKVAKLFTEPEN